MSGIGEAIAIASCVAALISAYKDGGTILNKIKKRRQARGALPPTIHLETSLEKGRNAIVEAVVEGRDRFGPGYEQGDDEAIRALQVITIETQAALLSRLAAATDDENITDFSACIAAADKGRLQALIVLNQMFIRKQAETSQPSQPVRIIAQDLDSSVSQSGQNQPYSSMGTSTNSTAQAISPLERELMQEDESRTGRRPRLGWRFGRRSSNRQSSDSLGPANPGSNNHSRSTSGGLSSSPPTPRSTFATPVSPNSRTMTDPFDQRGANTSTTPGLGIYHTNTFSTTGTRPSRSSSLAVSSISPVSERNDLCKSSYNLRAGQREEGLQFYDQSITPGQKNYRYKCKSTSCAFQCVARKPADSKKWFIEERIRSSSGMEFRWLFLAKSHVPRTSTKVEPNFRCLVCLLSGDNSSLFSGHSHLLEHVLGHQGAYLGTTLLEGPVSFSNEGVKSVDDRGFDIKFPPAVAKPSLNQAQFEPQFPATMDSSRQVDDKRATHWSDEIIDPWADAG